MQSPLGRSEAGIGEMWWAGDVGHSGRMVCSV